MPTGNDASTITVATSNCSFCAVAGIAGKSANEVMGMVYRQMGKPLPNGESDDSSTGFAEYYNYFHPQQKEKIPNKKILKYQIEGIRLFLLHRGYHTTKIGAPDKLMTIPEAETYVNQSMEGTIFLVLSGDEDVKGQGLTSLVHWTAGQVQGGKGVYYDYQTKILDKNVRTSIKRRAGRRATIGFDDTNQSDHIIAPLGQEYDAKDGRALLIKIK